MLARITCPNGVVYYRSTLLSHVPHGFSTRLGGVSVGPFASLNLATATNAPTPAAASPAVAVDDQANIQANYERFLDALHLAGRPRAWVDQIHSTRVERLEQLDGLALEDLLTTQFQGQRQADGLLTEIPGVVLSVRVADCVPLLLADAAGRVVAAVHAGWRGVVHNIAARAVRAFGEAGVLPGQIVAAIGPCIGRRQFEVGTEVASFFDLAGLSAAVDRTGAVVAGAGPKPHVDLVAAVASQLTAAGVGQIDLPELAPAGGQRLCTFQYAVEFFSHRRDHGVTGRMAALIALPTSR